MLSLIKSRPNKGTVLIRWSRVESAIRDEEIPGLSQENRFAILYSGIVQLSSLIISLFEFRLEYGCGHHKDSFRLLQKVLGPSMNGLVEHLQTFRCRRNAIRYEGAPPPTEGEIQQIRGILIKMKKIAEYWMQMNHPDIWRLIQEDRTAVQIA